MYIHETGPLSAPIILFLHGNGANGTMWKTHLNHFSDYHCLAPDFPGFGNTNQEEWRTLDVTAEQIIAIIHERVPSGCAHVVGLSLGGSTLLTLLGKAPQLIDHAIVDGAGVLPLPGLPFMKIGFRLLQPFLKTDFVIKMIANGTKIPPEDYAEFARNLRLMSASSFTRAFLQALSLKQPAGIEKARCPVLFVAGEKESPATHESNRLLAGMLPHAQARMAPGMNHGWLAEAPELHCRMVRAWIENQPLPTQLRAI